MIDQNTANEVREQNLRESAEQEMIDGDWPELRASIDCLEKMRVDTRGLRRRMNLAMAETDDITYEPYEAVIPFETEAERLTSRAPITYLRGGELAFGASSESLEQSRLSAEFGDNNA